MDNIRIIFDSSLKSEIVELYYYLDEVKFYEANLKNKDRRYCKNVTEIGISGIIYRKCPYRVYKKEKTGVSFGCPLCKAISGAENTPMIRGRNLLWRGYVIRPNDFPYLKDHLLILSSDHNQGIIPNVGTQNNFIDNDKYLFDMIDFHKILGIGTMYFNHLHGNSQLHYHFHYTTTTLPIQDFIYNEVNGKSIKAKTANKTNIVIFNHKKKLCFNGIYFYGEKKGIIIDVLKYIKRVIKNGYKFNLVILPQNKNSNPTFVNIIVYIRDDSKLKKDQGKLGTSIISGLYTNDLINKKNINSKTNINYLNDMCTKTVVEPSKKILKEVFNI